MAVSKAFSMDWRARPTNELPLCLAKLGAQPENVAISLIYFVLTGGEHSGPRRNRKRHTKAQLEARSARKSSA
jgi:hypothetical protein